jgi:two-component system, NtrC family, sensor histidine kinase HydH
VQSIFAHAFGPDVATVSAQEKQELLSRLLARLAHEIRNPLSSLHIHVQLLQEDVTDTLPGLTEKFANRFQIIHGELNRLETIVKHFISLSGSATLNVEPVDIAGIVKSVCDLLQPEAESRSIALSNRSSPTGKILADPVQLTQAVVNLVINAIQAIGTGGEVILNAALDPSRSMALIEVRDSGGGIDPSKQSHIFEPYYTTKPEGSGLGLWIVQQIVTAHQGTIRAANAPDGGAVFTIELPLNPAGKESSSGQEQRSVEQGIGGRADGKGVK